MDEYVDDRFDADDSEREDPVYPEQVWFEDQFLDHYGELAEQDTAA